MVCYVTSLLHLLRNTFSKNLHRSPDFRSQICVPTFFCPPTWMNRFWLGTRLHSGHIIAITIPKCVAGIQNFKIYILEQIQYHFYKNMHHICFLVVPSQWEKKAWGNSWEAGNTHGQVGWLNITDHVHQSQKKHVDGYSGDLGAEPQIPQALSDSP